MMNALRLTSGITENLFFERTGLPIKIIEKELMIAKNKNLLSLQKLHHYFDSIQSVCVMFHFTALAYLEL